MRQSSIFRLVLAVGLIATVFVGCSRDPNVRKQKYYESGQRYFDKGQYREAAIQYKNAIQIDSTYGNAHYQLALALLKLQQWSMAYQELGRTIELQPDNYQARIDLANLLIAGRDFKQAQAQTDLLLQQQPNNQQVHMAVANLLIGQENYSAAIQEMQKAIALAPNNWEPYLDLALVQIRANQPDAAEVNFKKAVEVNPQAVQAQLALGSYYQSRSRYPEAEQQFRHAMDLDPKNPDPPAAIARLYIAQGKKAEAEAFLKQVKTKFPDNSTGYRMLGDFYFATGDLDKATAEYASVYHDHPKDVQVEKNYIQLLILKNRLDEAGKLNDAILAANPNDNEALIYRGQIQIRSGHASNAVQTLQNALKNDPDSGVARYHLGLALDAMGNPRACRRRMALRRAPASGSHRGAARPRQCRHTQGRHGNSGTDRDADHQTAAHFAGWLCHACAFQNQSQAIHRRRSGREQSHRSRPPECGWHIQMGNLKLVQKQYSDAGKAFQQALDRDPNSNDALSGLMNTYLAQNQPDKVIAAANAQIVKSPNSSAFYDLLGTALFNSKKDLDGAEAAFTKAAQLDKSNSDALLKLGQVQVAKGSTDQALATYKMSLKTILMRPCFTF